MKKLLLIPIVLFAFISSYGKSINETTAIKIAKSFYIGKATTNSAVDKQNLSLSLAYKRSYTNANSSAKTINENLYYIFNVNANDGFVIVSGDDVVLPILGYGNKGAYSANNANPAFRKWMEGYKEQIEYAIENNLSATPEITTKWADLMAAPVVNMAKSTNSVNPLCSTTWDQGNGDGFYNAMCPTDGSLPDANNISTHCVTGCPATAMAQIMKYWNYPTMGSGFHSYSATTYGTLSANFGTTTYNWASMPNSVTSANAAVATLMYHCGVAVEMQYTPDESGGYVIVATSPNPTANCEYAYKNYFGYDPNTLQGLQRSNYTDVAWKALLETELNANRPVQYDGFGTNGGHTFVCDGYDASGNFHMNWGWSGIDDGYFDLDALNPSVLGAGGGSGGFNAGQEAVIGIKPLVPTGASADINLYSVITITPNPINFYQSFTVNADVINASTSSFSGYICAGLFDASGTFINYIAIDTLVSPLPANSHYPGGINFSNSGMLTVPGNYQVGIYFMPTGGNWTLAGNTTYSNPVPITIAGPYNPIELNSNIAATPTTFIQGQAASVNVDFWNTDVSTYTGEYSADLYDMDGNWVENIGTYTESIGLPANNSYNSPYITFSSASIGAAQGTYILAISVYDNASSTYYLAGGDYYTNPVNIQVLGQGLSPDIYEVNNTEPTAYSLPLNFVSNADDVVTTGSNIHISSDIDFYKIILPGGYSYVITARANDSYNSADGNTYTDDVLWSYDTGSGFSQAYDDVMPGNIVVNGSGTVTFQVASYFPGNVGTYVMDINITRSTLTGGLGEISNNDLLKVYPNPTNNILNISNTGNINFENLQIINYMGQVVADMKYTPSLTNIDVSYLTNGIYFLQATENGNRHSIKFVVDK